MSNHKAIRYVTQRMVTFQIFCGIAIDSVLQVLAHVNKLPRSGKVCVQLITSRMSIPKIVSGQRGYLKVMKGMHVMM